MMFLLLQTLVPELENDSEGEEIPNGTNGSADRAEAPKEIITAIARRVLPALRQYSTWLASSASFLMAVSAPQTSDITMTTRIIELWNLYATVLTKLSIMFPVAELPDVKYLLEEDESTVGFEPFLDSNLPTGCNLFKSVSGEMKPRITDQGLAREHPNVEMQSRIRDILIVGLSLAMNNDLPIDMNRAESGITFAFRTPGAQLSSPVHYPSSSAFPTPSHTSSTFSPRELRSAKTQIERDEHVRNTDAHHSMESDMSRMVDDLLDPSSQNNETSYGMHSRTANEVFAPIASNGYDSQYRSTPKMLPSLPGYYNSAFAPQPHELKPTSPIRPGTGGQLSPLSLNSEDERREAAAALDKMTGLSAPGSSPWGRQPSQAKSSSYKSFAKQLEEGVDDPDVIPPKFNSWGRQLSRPVSGSLPRPVSQILQDSLAQQFMPMSSNFSDSSSLYANSTPMPARNGGAGSWDAAFSAMNGGNSTVYAGASDFDRETMLQSSIWNGSQKFPGPYVGTPPGGQGG